jgi:hypothetical protein
VHTSGNTLAGGLAEFSALFDEPPLYHCGMASGESQGSEADRKESNVVPPTEFESVPPA